MPALNSQTFWFAIIIALSSVIASHLSARPFANKYSDGHDIGISIMGTIGNRESRDNVALIKELASGKVRALKREFLFNDYHVKEITSKYVVLEKQQLTHLVFLNKFAGEFAGGASVPEPLPTNLPLTSGLEAYVEDGFERRGNKVTVSAKLRDKLIGEDLSNILMQATAIPAMENGAIIGFRLLQIDGGSIFDKAGLRDNDIIQTINGMQLNSIAGAVKLLKSLRNTPKVEMDVVRGGGVVKLEMNVAH